MSQPIIVPVQCTFRFADGQPCGTTDPDAHVHQLDRGCSNDAYDRHHAYAPPAYVRIAIAGKVKRVRLGAPQLVSAS